MSWVASVSPLRTNDPRLRGLSYLARLIWCQLLASELATRIPGLARGGPGTIAEHLGAPFLEVEAALAELVDAGAVEVDAPARLLRLPGVAGDHHRSAANRNMVLHWLRHVADLPRSPLVARHAAELGELCGEKWAERWARVAHRHGVGRALEGPAEPSRSPPAGLDERCGRPGRALGEGSPRVGGGLADPSERSPRIRSGSGSGSGIEEPPFPPRGARGAAGAS